MKLSFKVFFVLMLSFVLVACGQQAESNRLTAYKVSALMQSSVNRADAFGGLVVAQQTKEFQKDETKVIKEIFVKAGDAVTADTVIFSYDTDAISIDIEKAQLEIERMNNSITSNQNQITNLTNERAQVPASQQFSYTLEIQTLEAEIRETQYNIRAKQVELDRLVASVENSEVKAGIDGLVQSVNDTNQPNQFGGDGNAFITILQTGNFRIKGQVNEMNIHQIYAGLSVTIISRIDSSKTWSGVVETVEMNNPGIPQDQFGGMQDQMTNSTNYPFFVTLNETEGLFLGQHVYIVAGEVESAPKEGAWVFGHYIVYGDDGSMKIWKVDESKRAHLVDIEVGEMDPMTGQLQITSGLTEDDYIVEPDDSLKDGASVNLAEGD